MSDTRFTIELAKSGRTSCKRCKEKIPKDALRIGTHSHNGDYEVTSWAHAECFVIPRKLKLTAAEFLEDVLEDTSGDILPAQTGTLIATLESKKPKKKEPSKVSVIDHVKRAYEESKNDEGRPPSKKLKTEVELYGTYSNMKADLLKDYMRWNRQLLKGNKDEVLFKILDGCQHGRLAFCGLCGGKLKFNDEYNRVICSGRFDEDLNVRRDCAFSCSIADAPRALPWYTQEPTEEENAAMDKLGELARGGPGATEEQSSDAIAILDKATADVDWNLSSKQGIQKTVATFTQAVVETGLLNLKEKPNIQIGSLVSRHRALSRADFLPILLEECGLASVQEEKDAKKKANLENAVKVAENADLVAAFAELSELYFKASNTNAGLTYKKVVGVLAALEFAITTENAPGLYKGKTKLKGIGKSTGEKIVEFLGSGKIQKLEDKRAEAKE